MPAINDIALITSLDLADAADRAEDMVRELQAKGMVVSVDLSTACDTFRSEPHYTLLIIGRLP